MTREARLPPDLPPIEREIEAVMRKTVEKIELEEQQEKK